MRVVIDANVAISAVAARGLCESVMELCIESHELFFCDEILNDVEEKLISKIKVPQSLAEAYVRTLKESSKMMLPSKMDGNVCRDPDDHVVLGLAKAAKADFIITEDNDLLSLIRFDGVEIVSPRRFMEKNRR